MVGIAYGVPGMTFIVAQPAENGYTSLSYIHLPALGRVLYLLTLHMVSRKVRTR